MFFSGVLIGIANLIPGISGGTISVIVGIYDELIIALSDFFSAPLRNREATSLLTIVSLGVICGIYFFSGLIDTLITMYTFSTVLFFIGLIVGSIPMLCRNNRYMKPTILRIGSFLITFMGMLLLTWNTSIALTQTTLSPWKLILSGGLAAGSMIIPGISGSFILVMLGTYRSILQAIRVGDLEIIGWVLLGSLIGIILVSKILAKLIKKFRPVTHYAILGLILGSAIVLFPSLEGQTSDVLIQGFLCFVSGFIIVQRLGKS